MLNRERFTFMGKRARKGLTMFAYLFNCQGVSSSASLLCLYNVTQNRPTEGVCHPQTGNERYPSLSAQIFYFYFFIFTHLHPICDSFAF